MRQQQPPETTSDRTPEPPSDIAAGMARFQDHYYDALLGIAHRFDPVTGDLLPKAVRLNERRTVRAS